MACHIYAAADQRPARRRSPGGIDLQAATNGIWMCYTHGKLIDTDEATYTVEQLLAWKRIAELRADFRQRASRDPSTREYLNHSAGPVRGEISFSKAAADSKRIGELLRSSGASTVWGKPIAHSVRDFAVEILRNAFVHGRATSVTVQLTSSGLAIRDDGAPFDVFSLPCAERPRGGARALTHILDLAAAGLIVTSQRTELNTTTVTLTASLNAALAANPCVVEAKAHWEDGPNPQVPAPGCAKTYLVFRTSASATLFSQLSRLTPQRRLPPIVAPWRSSYLSAQTAS